MLNQGIKCLAIFLAICTLVACEDKKKEELNQKRALYKKYSIRQVGTQEYTNVFKAANDSLKNWTDNHLSGYAIYEENGWYLDSLVCFNKSRDRCIMALSYQLCSSSNHDGMECLYGAKIKGKWYFFRGAISFIT